MSELFPTRVRRAIALVLVIAYAVLIYGGSSRKAPDTITDLSIPDFVLHMVEYGGLGFLLCRWLWLATGKSNLGMLVLLPTLIATLFGVTDEIHQSFVPERDAAAVDVLADAVGALVGAVVYRTILAGISRHRTTAVLVVVMALFSPAVRAGEDPLAAAETRIDAADMRAHTAFLASPELRGRDTPSKDLDVAARYLALRFRAHGFEPGAKDGRWFQDVPLTFRVNRGGNFVRILAETSGRTYDGEHLGMPAGSPDGLGAGPVVFAGYGMVVPGAKWNDYSGLDVKGKVVVVFDGTPAWVDRKHPLAAIRGRRAMMQAGSRGKAKNAADRGAVAMLFVTSPKHQRVDRVRLVDGSFLEGKVEKIESGYRVTTRVRRREYLSPADLRRIVLGDGREVTPDPGSRKPIEVLVTTETREVSAVDVAWVEEGVTPLPAPRFARRLLRGGRKPAGGVPTLEISAALAEDLLGRGIGELADLAVKGGGSFAVPDRAVVVRVRTEVETAVARNVVAMRPGRERQDEAVVITAHYDHVGVGAGGEVYAGADDNASGTTVLLELAEALAALPAPPARPVYLVAVAGEERGFLGSAAFVADPPIPLDDMLVNLNLDMVGRGPADEIRVMIGPLGTDLAGAFRRAEAAARMRPSYEVLPAVGGKLPPLTGREKLSVPVPRSAYFGRSDQVQFYRKGIPAAFLFGGTHEDYHRPTDTPDKLNLARMVRVGRFVLRVAHGLAEEGLPRRAADPEASSR